MKKFLYCLIFLISFSGISSAVLVNNGYDGANRQIASTATSTQIESVIDSTDSNLGIDGETASSSAPIGNNKGRTRLIYDVVLLESADAIGFYTEEKINSINQLLNDADPYNDVYSVYEYFQDASYNQVKVNANLLLYKSDKPMSYYDIESFSYEYEYNQYLTALSQSTQIKGRYGTANSSMLIFSTVSTVSYDSRLWAHTFRNTTFISLCYGYAKIGTLCHEIMHSFGVRDTYIQDVNAQTPVAWWDLNGNGSQYCSNSLMYNKLTAGWVETSNYGDNRATEIETITKSGRYTLSPTISTTGTRAYKFGIKKGDSKVYFMVEYRKGSTDKIDRFNKSGLIVYRLNENFKEQGNLNKKPSEYEIFVYRKFNSDTCYNANLEDGDYCGSLSNQRVSLCYEDGTMSSIIIDNIVIDEETDTASFDFADYTNTKYVEGVVRDSGGACIPYAEIMINGIKAGTANKYGEFIVTNVAPNSTLTAVAPNNSRLIFNPITVNPYTTDLLVKAEPLFVATISVKDGKHTEMYSIYKLINDEWRFCGFLDGDEVYTVSCAENGVTYKFKGFNLETIVVLTEDSKDVVLVKEEPKKEETKEESEDEEEKSTLGKVAEAITSVPGKVKDTLVNAYDTLAETAGNIADKAGNWYDRAKEKVRNFFHF